MHIHIPYTFNFHLRIAWIIRSHATILMLPIHIVCSLKILVCVCVYAISRSLSLFGFYLCLCLESVYFLLRARFVIAHLLVAMLVWFACHDERTLNIYIRRHTSKHIPTILKGIINFIHTEVRDWMQMQLLKRSSVSFFLFQVRSIFPLTNLWWNGIEPWQNVNEKKEWNRISTTWYLYIFLVVGVVLFIPKIKK